MSWQVNSVQQAQAVLMNLEWDDRLVDGTASMFGNSECPAHLHALAKLAHQDDRVRVR